MQGQFLSLGWTLELNLNSNSAQMAIVLRHIFHSSQASPFINYPNVSIFTCWITWDYIWAKFFHRLQASAPKYTTWSSQELSTQPVPQPGGTGEGESIPAWFGTRMLLIAQNKPFQNPSKWAKGNSPSSADLFQSLTHPLSRLVPITGRKLYHFPGCVYKKGWSYTCPSFYIALGLYVQLNEIRGVSHRKKCDALKLNHLRKKI